MWECFLDCEPIWAAVDQTVSPELSDLMKSYQAVLGRMLWALFPLGIVAVVNAILWVCRFQMRIVEEGGDLTCFFGTRGPWRLKTLNSFNWAQPTGMNFAAKPSSTKLLWDRTQKQKKRWHVFSMRSKLDKNPRIKKTCTNYHSKPTCWHLRCHNQLKPSHPAPGVWVF